MFSLIVFQILCSMSILDVLVLTFSHKDVNTRKSKSLKICRRL